MVTEKLQVVAESIGFGKLNKDFNLLSKNATSVLHAFNNLSSKNQALVRRLGGSGLDNMKKLTDYAHKMTVKEKALKDSKISEAKTMALTRKELMGAKRAGDLWAKLGIPDMLKETDVGFKDINKVIEDNSRTITHNRMGLKRFRMEFLSTMFFGMQVWRTFGGFFKDMIRNYKELDAKGNRPLTRALTKLSATFTYLKFQILDAMGPLLTEFLISIAGALMAIADTDPAILEKFGIAIGVFAVAGLGMFVGSQVKLFLDAVGGIGKLAGLSLTGISAPIMAGVLAVVALLAAFVYLGVKWKWNLDYMADEMGLWALNIAKFGVKAFLGLFMAWDVGFAGLKDLVSAFLNWLARRFGFDNIFPYGATEKAIGRFKKVMGGVDDLFAPLINSAKKTVAANKAAMESEEQLIKTLKEPVSMKAGPLNLNKPVSIDAWNTLRTTPFPLNKELSELQNTPFVLNEAAEASNSLKLDFITLEGDVLPEVNDMISLMNVNVEKVRIGFENSISNVERITEEGLEMNKELAKPISKEMEINVTVNQRVAGGLRKFSKFADLSDRQLYSIFGDSLNTAAQVYEER